MIDINNTPIIDNHCHAFIPAKENADFYKYFNLSFLDVPKKQIENTLLYRIVIQELSLLFNCKFDYEEVVLKRQEKYENDPSSYIRKLFRSMHIDLLIVDTGYPTEKSVYSIETTGYSVPINDFQNLIGCKVKSLYRLEPLTLKLFSELLPFDKFLDKYIESINHAILKENYTGIKSAIAYIFGLQLTYEKKDTIKQLYEDLRNTNAFNRPLNERSLLDIEKEKKIRHFLLWTALERCIDLDVPVQIHTGMGNSPWIDLRDANPLHLLNILKYKKFQEAKIVIVHSGYPYVEETGYLTNNYPNVYADISEMIPFASIGINSKLLNLLEMAPASKILYGSDGYAIPELFWISARLAKNAIRQALDYLIQSKTIDLKYAYKVAKMIFYENSKKLYKI